MAMTKKEKAEFDSAIYSAELLAALRWTQEVNPDLPKPQNFNNHIEGWDFNAVTKKVEKYWSDSVSHGPGESYAQKTYGSQKGMPLYSTKSLALKALRHAIELKAAQDLLAIDKRIDLMDDWDSVDADTRPKALANLIRASADLGGSARGTAKWKADNERKIREEAANAAENVAKAEGVSPETIARIRREVLGMAA